MLDPKTNTVIQTNMTLNVLISRPIWKPGTPAPSAVDAQLLDKITSMIKVHENKHADIRRAAAKKFTCQIHDMTVDQATNAIKNTMPCEITKADLALDIQEGNLVPVYQAGKLFDVKAVPKRTRTSYQNCHQDVPSYSALITRSGSLGKFLSSNSRHSEILIS